jgi:hypothetical protein
MSRMVFPRHPVHRSLSDSARASIGLFCGQIVLPTQRPSKLLPPSMQVAAEGVSSLNRDASSAGVSSAASSSSDNRAHASFFSRNRADPPAAPVGELDVGATSGAMNVDSRRLACMSSRSIPPTVSVSCIHSSGSHHDRRNWARAKPKSAPVSSWKGCTAMSVAVHVAPSVPAGRDTKKNSDFILCTDVRGALCCVKR